MTDDPDDTLGHDTTPDADDVDGAAEAEAVEGDGAAEAEVDGPVGVEAVGVEREDAEVKDTEVGGGVGVEAAAVEGAAAMAEVEVAAEAEDAEVGVGVEAEAAEVDRAAEAEATEVDGPVGVVTAGVEVEDAEVGGGVGAEDAGVQGAAAVAEVEGGVEAGVDGAIEIGDETDEEVAGTEADGAHDATGEALTEHDAEPVAAVAAARQAGATLDPAALQVLISRLTGIAQEMGAVLRRAAFSPNIKERADCSAALFDAEGELLVQAEHIPVHLGSMPAAVAAAIDAFGEEIEAGEQIVLNDPFAGGTHLNDITVVAPCHVDGEIVGWVANRAHHADLGGATPGSIPPEATEIQQEGLRLPPVRLNGDVREVIVASSRTPEERRGDLDAQWGANVVGASRLAAEADRPLGEVAAYGERRMRAALAALPDGRWDFTDVLDSTGPRPEQQAAATICVGVTIEGDEITFDFTGTDDQRRGNMNAVAAVTDSAVAYALRSAVVPDLEGVGGSMRPVTVIAPEGTLVAARPPVAVGAGNVEVSQRIADVCLGALAQVVPDRVAAASQGTMNNVLIGGDGWVYYETIGGGQGARPDRTGMNGVHTGMTNTRNTPIEALERSYPLRVRRLRLRQGSGGRGRQQGGEGIERDLEVLEPATVSLVTERRVFPPWGLDGGGPGALGENWLLPGGDESRAERLGDKVTLELRRGDVLRLRTPGGGGHGHGPALAE